MKRKTSGIAWGLIVVFLLIAIVFYTQFTLFVIQPIGAVPEGRTLLIARLNKGEFIDSADAMCVRIQDKVNLLCRMAVLGAVGSKTTIYLRMPYSETLYLISTGGRTFDR